VTLLTPGAACTCGEAHLREPLAGEGAGAFGGHEVGPLERCRAALALALAGALDASQPVEALYLRPPHITAPRATRAVPA
jgi:hypothetical protein